MFILTDYYKFERKALIAKTRMDCTASTKSYPEFENKRATKAIKASEKRDATNAGDLIIYYGDVSNKYGGNIQDKAGKAISIKGNNLSSVFVPEPNSGLGYGDVRGTDDALLFVIDLHTIDDAIQAGGTIEIFIARGASKDQVPLYNLLADGGLDDEMEYLRKQAHTKDK